MNYKETLAFLYEQLPMFQRIGSAAFKKDLTNIKELLAVLGNPETKFPSIHVGGTNGKGSVTHLLGAALQAGGYKTGLYTSPHYKDFRERIKVNGAYVSRKFVVDFVDRIRPELARISPSFFEITVAMAFQYFAEQKVDIAVVEVGLGGRLDSTNVLNPELAVITNISLDHQQFLGDTLPEIAGEKAGIIKANVPVVIGETQQATAPVFRSKAKEVGAPLVFADQLFQVKQTKQDFNHTYFSVDRKHQLYTSELIINLHGPYQALNIQTALAALEVWQMHHAERTLPFTAIQEGWANLRDLTRFQGRWQVLSEQPRVMVDSAHNEGGLKAIMDQLKAASGQLHFVMGVVSDKKLEEVLPLFPPNAKYYFAKADIPRGLPASDLQQTAAHFGLKGKTYTSVKNALKAAKRAAAKEDTIFVGGSIFTVAEVL
ncbi:folylpolyglutamate synthase/dihydrofolate synthase family protein [Lewinella sp. LCG006]|uniref:bifunctional folylpolyglutamate synthase/dihydrofolate synthase n=1 Tax=Lewinella sp. LCG006 TaxID=3231911 RepID=UPI00345FE450